MKIFKSILIILICFIIAVLPGCRYSGGIAADRSVLKIGVEGIEGVFNPFYAESQADLEIVSQMFRPIQIKTSDNTFINHSGSISYEYVGDSQVKYTVSINDDMFFSDGSHITIDDVISFYYFISDATYDGSYKDWYLNDIVGLKEYYFDDKNFTKSISDIESTVADKYSLTTISVADYSKYLVETKLEDKYNGIDSQSPSGVIWKDYVSDLGYANEIRKISENPSDEAWLKLVAQAEAEKNPNAYNPENWYRELLYKNYLKDNYTDGTAVSEISGIKKINDYTCSILFDSRNINAISEINVPIIPRSCYTTDYIKGSADKVKESEYFIVGSGPYIIADKDESEVTMSLNDFYSDERGFRTIKFIDLKDSRKNAVENVVSGKVDVINTLVNSVNIAKLKDAPVQYFIGNCDYYVSMFFNSRSLDKNARIALMGICNPSATVDSLVGSYYTRVLLPLSIRFKEYPDDVEKVYYDESSFSIYSKLSQTPMNNLTAYYCGTEEDLEYAVLNEYKNILSQKDISLQIIISDEATKNAAIISGNADIWLERVYDGATCDKYDYFNSLGSANKTGIKSDEIDNLTFNIRSAVGFADKTKLTSHLMTLVMEEAVEWPLYQFQNITVYNTETIDAHSFSQFTKTDGFTYNIPYLKPAE